MTQRATEEHLQVAGLRLDRHHVLRGARHFLHLRSLAGGIIALAALLGFAFTVSAHAEPERANPAINGVVPVAPARVEIWFNDEVRTEGTTIQVIGPDGLQVDLSDAAVDLQDPNRRLVTASLRPNLGPGTYSVQWVSVSGADGEEARGEFLFHVGSASPVATPAAIEAAAPDNVVTTPVAEDSGAPEAGDFDSQAFGISIGAGVGVAILIFIFWRVVRPKNPRFR